MTVISGNDSLNSYFTQEDLSLIKEYGLDEGRMEAFIRATVDAGGASGPPHLVRQHGGSEPFVVVRTTTTDS